MKKRNVLILASLISILFAVPALAEPILSGGSSDGITWTASDSYGRSAQAVVSSTDSTLNILLSNEAAATTVPNTVLLGLFFDAANLTLSDPHVTVAPGSTAVSSTPSYHIDGDLSKDLLYGTNLDGEYGYLHPINNINGDLGDYGIAGTGFDPSTGAPVGWSGFGVGSIIDTSKSYVPPVGLGGAEWGMVNGDLSGLNTSSITSYVNNSVLISFHIDSGTFDSSSIGQMNFLYGTSYEGSVPEPSSLLLLGTGLVGLAGLARKGIKKS